MKQRLRSLCLWSSLALAPLVFTACGDDDDGYDAGQPAYQGEVDARSAPNYGEPYRGGPGERERPRYAEQDGQRYNQEPGQQYDQAADVFALGYEAGRADFKAGRNRAYARHIQQGYSSEQGQRFRDGYNEGFADGEDASGGMNTIQRRYYVNGYNFGRDDAKARRRANYMRYQSQFPPAQANLFGMGYEDGFYGRPKR